MVLQHPLRVSPLVREGTVRPARRPGAPAPEQAVTTATGIRMNRPIERDMTVHLGPVIGDEEKRTPQPESKAMRSSTVGIRRRMSRWSSTHNGLEGG